MDFAAGRGRVGIKSVDLDRHWERWSVRFEWIERAASYDDYVVDQELKQLERERQNSRPGASGMRSAGKMTLRR